MIITHTGFILMMWHLPMHDECHGLFHVSVSKFSNHLSRICTNLYSALNQRRQYETTLPTISEGYSDSEPSEMNIFNLSTVNTSSSHSTNYAAYTVSTYSTLTGTLMPDTNITNHQSFATHRLDTMQHTFNYPTHTYEFYHMSTYSSLADTLKEN